jgi:integrase
VAQSAARRAPERHVPIHGTGTLEHLSKDQIEAVLTQAFGCRERDGLMILTAWYHGLRASELVGIIRDDIPDGYLRVKRLKGSLLTVQALFENPNPLFDERRRLEHFISGMAGNQRVFPVTRRTFHRIFRKHALAVGIPQHLAHPHILKHSIAMQTIQTAGIENVRQHLGHKSMSSTGEYLKTSDSAATAAISGALTGKPRV